MNDIYAVAGDPVFMSRSPVMFNTALRQLSLDALYIRLAASTAREAADMARKIGIRGLNVTSPFKTDIIPCLDGMEGDAEKTGSVNTVVSRNGSLIGLNTDVAGVLGALNQAGFDPKGKSAVVLGAGGAARSAAFALLKRGGRVTISNRTGEKARRVADDLGCGYAPLVDMGESLRDAHLLVAAVSTFDRIVDPRWLRRGLIVLDANYQKKSVLVDDAERAGATLVDGREWLLAQALPAFEVFTGRPASLPAMRRALWKRRKDGRKTLALVGFMGSGKSVVAEALGRLTGRDVVDIDRRVEERAGRSVAEIFADAGEEAFRRMEQEEIDAIRLSPEVIVSCGGGAVLARSNRRVLRNNCVTVWLWADPETTLARIGPRASRPLLDGRSKEEITALFEGRKFLYASVCDMLVDTGGKSPEEIAKRIWHETYHTVGP